MRPPAPVPTIWVATRPCSRSSRRTAGVIRASASSVAGAVALGAAPTDAAAARCGISWTPRSSDPAGPVAAIGAAAAGATGGGAGAVGASCVIAGCGSVDGAACSACAGAPGAAGVATVALPSSAVSITAISALFGTVAPSSTRISRRIPSYGEGTSAFTLSVMTSSSGSYFATVSPGFLSHFPIVPSATLSPSWGMVTLATS